MAGRQDLGQGSILKLLLSMALPAIVAQIINALYNVVDRMYIGQIEGVGTAALTGVGLSLPLILVITAFAALIGAGGAPKAAIRLGAEDHEGAERILGNCVTSLLTISVILTITMSIFAEPLLLLFGASENTVGYGTDYLQIYLVGTVFVQLVLGLNPFITAQGFPRISMMTTLIGAFLNIILDPIFIFVLGMGVQGAALATVLSQAVSAIWVVRFLLSDKAKLRIKRQNLRVQPHIILPVLALGVSPFVMQITESLLSISFNSSLQRYGGDLAVGAMTICVSIMQMFYMPLQGFTQGAQPITSYNFGARNIERCRKTFYCLLTICVSYSMIAWSIAMLFPEILVQFFTSDPVMIEKASWALRIYLALNGIMGAQNACQNTLLGLEQAKTSLFLALLRKMILLIPLIFILPNFFEDKVFAVFLAEPVADTLAVMTTFTVFMLRFPKILKRGPKLHRA